MFINGLSDVGKKRNINQDCFAIEHLGKPAELIVLCDGMGGAVGGELASNLAKNTIVSQIKASYRENMNPPSVIYTLQSALAAANITVFGKALSDPSLSGMGTTAVAVLIADNTAYIAHVGDSRAYLISGNSSVGMTQLTTDHSIVQMMVESGQITPEQAMVHPKRNIITRAIGVSDSVKADINQVYIADSDKLLVCSDGLTNYLSENDIYDIVYNNPSEIAVNELIKRANENGGGDNITAVVAHRQDNIATERAGS